MSAAQLVRKFSSSAVALTDKEPKDKCGPIKTHGAISIPLPRAPALLSLAALLAPLPLAMGFGALMRLANLGSALPLFCALLLRSLQLRRALTK